jgi:hypothetical protein
VRRLARAAEPGPPERPGRGRARPDRAAGVEDHHLVEAGAVLHEVRGAGLQIGGRDGLHLAAELRELLHVPRQAEADVLLEPEDVADHGAALLVELLAVEQPEQAEQREDEQGDRDARRVPLPAVGGGRRRRRAGGRQRGHGRSGEAPVAA